MAGLPLKPHWPVIEKNRHEFFARQGEAKTVLAFAIATLFTIALTLTAFGSFDLIAFLELAIARMDRFVITTLAMSKRWLGDVFGRNFDGSAALHLFDRALSHHIAHSTLNVRLITAHKTFAIDRAFVAIIQTAVDDY